MNKIRIALIDSGVEINHSELYDKSIQGIEVICNNTKSYVRNSFADSNGHGTALAGIIFDKCENVDLISIKILDENLKCSFDALYNALQIAIKENVRIINLSLGITKKINKERLYELCKSAFNKDIYIISAFHNNGILSYPAAFNEVIGVIGEKIKYKYGYVYNNDKNEFIANGELQKVCWKNNGYKYMKGNSFACAHITGILAHLMYENSTTNFSVFKEMLIKYSLNSNVYMKVKLDERKWMKKILFFPINQENLNIMEKINDYEHESVGIYDPRITYYNYFEIKKDLQIKKVKIYKSLVQGLEQADTLMVGDLSFIPKDKQKDLKIKIIKQALILGRNVLCKEDLLIDEYRELYKIAKEKNVKLISGHI